MELTVVGCSGSGSGPDSPASSYLIQAPYEGRTFSLVLDLGPGAFGALYRYLPPEQVDVIGLSHLHPDHCLDLCAFYVGASYSVSAPWPRIPVYGPAGTAERMLRAYEVPPETPADVPGPAPTLPSIADRFDYRTWQPEQRVGPFTVRTVRVAHPVPTYAVRVGDPAGRTLTFSGDTGPCPELVNLARDSDLLLIEAAFLDRPDNLPGLHLSGRQAAEIATAARVSAVVLTHIPPWHDPHTVRAEAEQHYRGPIDLARAGSRFVL